MVYIQAIKPYIGQFVITNYQWRFFQPYPLPEFRSVKFPCGAVTVKHNPLESEFYPGRESLTDSPSWVIIGLFSFIL